MSEEKETVAIVKLGRILTDEEQKIFSDSIEGLRFDLKRLALDIEFEEREC